MDGAALFRKAQYALELQYLSFPTFAGLSDEQEPEQDGDARLSPRVPTSWCASSAEPSPSAVGTPAFEAPETRPSEENKQRALSDPRVEPRFTHYRSRPTTVELRHPNTVRLGFICPRDDNTRYHRNAAHQAWDAFLKEAGSLKWKLG